MSKYISCILAIYFILGLVFLPEQCIEAARGGLNLCLNVIIPSLFPFFVCSKILIKNGFAKKVSKPLGIIMRPIFNVPGCGAFAFVAGCLSGCPVGAKTVTDMYADSLCTKAEAQRMLCFCNNFGPMFIMGSVAVGMLGYKEIGVILYISHILSAIIVGIAMSRYKYREVIKIKPKTIKANQEGTLSSSIAESVSLIGYVCGFVIFFAVLISIFSQSGMVEIITQRFPAKNIVRGAIYGMIEMTNGISSVSGDKIDASMLCAISFILGFGGASAILQVSGIISKYRLSTICFCACKFLQGIISAVLTYIILSYSKIDIPVFSSVGKISSINYWAFSINIFALFGIILLILSILSIACNFLRRM